MTRFVDGRLASGGRDGKLKVWSVSTGEALLSVDAHKGSVQCVEVTSCKRIGVAMASTAFL